MVTIKIMMMNSLGDLTTKSIAGINKITTSSSNRVEIMEGVIEIIQITTITIITIIIIIITMDSTVKRGMEILCLKTKVVGMWWI